MAQDEEAPGEEPGDSQPFLSHLEELRSRLIKAGAAVLVGFFACYSQSETLFALIARPVKEAIPKGGNLGMFRPMEGFNTNLKIAFVGGIILAAPVILYQLWKFVAPGLYAHEKKWVWPFVIAATLFFLLGASFAYFVVFPVAFKILFGYDAGGWAQVMPSMESALDFPLKLLLAFGLIFELPVVVFFLAKMGLVHYQMLSKNRGYSLVIILIAAAVLTPTGDPFNQLLMAAPLYVLFELSILVARFFGPKPPGEEEDEEEAPAGA
jgi:sec-independent protein translocase protein TatC